MSTLRVAGTARRISQAPRTNFLEIARSQVASRRFSAPVIALIGLLAIQGLSLVLGALISQGAYNLAHLKQTNHEISTSTEILASQVESLSSEANLADAAHGLGMVANTTPVFLRLADQKVIGKPTAAYASTGTVARNLVPNAALSAKTNIAQIKLNAAAQAAALAAKKLATPAKVATSFVAGTVQNTNVAKQVSGGTQLASNGGLKASPTH